MSTTRPIRHPDFGARVRYLRESKDWSIQELADAMEVDRAAASRWDTGETKPRDTDKLFAKLGTTAAKFYALRIPSRYRTGARAA